MLSSALLLAVSWLTFAATAQRPHVVIVVGTHHYSPHKSLPVFAGELERFGFRTTIVMGDGDPEKKESEVLPGIEALAEADAAVFFMRFLRLPDAEWAPIEAYIRSGKPVIGLRTANHSFRYPVGHPRHAWNDGFGRRVLGTPYVVHQAGTTEIHRVAKYGSHPIMAGIAESWTSPGTLYLTRLEPGCVPLLYGTGRGKARLVEREFGTVQVNESESDIVAWTWENEWGSRVFATSLGHTGDFAEESFVRLVINGICWAVEKPLPAGDERVSTWSIARVDGKARKPKRQN